MKEQIKELKIELGNLINWSWILGKTCDSEEDFKRLQETDKRIDEISAELFQLTGDYIYATYKEVVKSIEEDIGILMSMEQFLFLNYTNTSKLKSKSLDANTDEMV